MVDFERLAEIAAEADARPQWRGYARYLRQRIEGLRRPSMETLRGFIGEARAWPALDCRAFVQWVGEQRERYTHQPEAVMPQPLYIGLVRPVLMAWAEAEADEPTPCLWLGRLGHGGQTWHDDPEPFWREALRRRPDHAGARLDLARLLIERVDFSQHHLPGGYIGDPETDVEWLNEADALLAGLEDPQAQALCVRSSGLRRRAVEWKQRAEA